MNREDFFVELRQKCNNETEYLLELLKLRGFLFENLHGELRLSDMSYKEDAWFLNDLLVQCFCGKMKGKEVFLLSKPNIAAMEKVFADNPPIEGAYENDANGRSTFKHRIHGETVPVELLDPFIARYIKAISACSVPTIASCDGNHPQMNQMYLMIKDRTSRIWHKLICVMCLAGVYEIKWNADCTAIEFDEKTKYNTYWELNRAAEYLYDHRQIIRGILNTAMMDLAGCFFQEHSADEIENAFINKVTQLFCNSVLLRVR